MSHCAVAIVWDYMHNSAHIHEEHIAMINGGTRLCKALCELVAFTALAFLVAFAAINFSFGCGAGGRCLALAALF